jgi:hypothetical protein
MKEGNPIRPRRRLLARRFVACAVIGVLAVFGYSYWTRPQPTPPTTIFRGVSYACNRLPETPNGRGYCHIVCINLNDPEIELYLTPPDLDAVAKGHEYRLESARTVLKREDLAVVVNGGLFTSESGFFPRRGDLATSIDILVTEHHINHFYPYNYLIWFEDDLTPHIDSAKPPREEVLANARFAIGSQMLVLTGGVVSPWADAWPPLDRQTAVGVDSQSKRLWLAVFEQATGSVVARVLADAGATDAALLDGGDSTTMVIGAEAQHVRRGTLIGGWRPVATFLGVRALPVENQ